MKTRALLGILAVLVISAAVFACSITFRAFSYQFGQWSALSLASTAAAKFGDQEYLEPDAYRMPHGAWCVNYKPVSGHGSLVVFVAKEHGSWAVEKVLRNAKPVELSR